MFNSQFVPLGSLLQAPSNSCQTTTECAVLCTGWGFKMSSVPVFPPVSRVGNICLPPSLQQLKPDVSRWCQDWIGSHYHLSLLTLGYHSFIIVRLDGLGSLHVSILWGFSSFWLYYTDTHWGVVISYTWIVKHLLDTKKPIMNINSLQQSIFIISVSIVSVLLYITEAPHSHKLK